MELTNECPDSPLSEKVSCSTQSSDLDTPPRGLEGLRRRLKLQHINSVKLNISSMQSESDEKPTGPNPYKSPNKRKFQESYTPLETIGQGTCGVVKKVRCLEDNKIYVAKITRGYNQEYVEQVKKEYQILSELKHKNIVEAKEMLFDEATGTAHLILEYVPGRTLEDLIIEKGCIGEDLVKHIVEQVISALKYIHDLGICHRDICPNNILINEQNDVKIIDFSVSKIYRQELWNKKNSNSAPLRKRSSFLMSGYSNFMITNTGTAYYKAPEVVTNGPYTNTVDMWSLGVVIFYALVGYRPFSAKHVEKLYDKIRTAKYKWDAKLWANISYEAILFVKACLKQHSFIRLTTKEAFYHPWIKRVKLSPTDISEQAKRAGYLSPPPRMIANDHIINNAKLRKSFLCHNSNNV